MPPHLPSTRTGRMKEFQSRPATPDELLVQRADHARPRGCHATSCRVVSQLRKRRVGLVGGVDPVAGIGRIGVAAVAIVGHVRARLTKSKPGSSFPPRSARPRSGMVVEHAGVEHRDDHARGSALRVPGADGIHRGNLGVLQVPLIGKQRVVGIGGVRKAATIDGHVFDGGIGSQPLQRLCGTGIAEIDAAGQHAGRDLALEVEDETGALGQCRRAIHAGRELGADAPASSLRSFTITERLAAGSALESCEPGWRATGLCSVSASAGAHSIAVSKPTAQEAAALSECMCMAIPAWRDRVAAAILWRLEAKRVPRVSGPEPSPQKSLSTHNVYYVISDSYIQSRG